MAVPTRDSKLIPWTTTFNDTMVAHGTAVYHLSASEVTEYTSLHTPYLAAAAAVADPAQRNKSLVAARNSAKKSLVDFARQLYGRIQSDMTISDQAKVDAGITIRAHPAPVPPPGEAPEIDIVSTRGRTLRIRLHGEEALKRAKPPGVSGATVLSFIGDAPPAKLTDWVFQGNTSKTIVDINFPSDTPNGATVWVTAFWFNNRKQSGPPCDAKSANLPGGSVSMSQAA